jgi:hypothetical protein
LSQNLAELAQRGKRLKAAREALQQELTVGNPAAVATAKQAELAARQSAGGYLSKVKALIGEAYVPRWKDWLIQIESFEEAAQRAAAELPGQWTVRPIAGNLRLDGAETWDQAILLVRAGSAGSPPRAKLFLAAPVQGREAGHGSGAGGAGRDPGDRDVGRASAALPDLRGPIRPGRGLVP